MHTSKLLLLTLLVAIISCQNNQQKETTTSNSGKHVFLKYAKGFTANDYNGITELTVPEPFKGATEPLTYWLVPKTIETPDSLKNEVVVRTPLSSIVCTSTTHITPLDLLNVSDKLIGFPSTQYISSEKVRAQVENGSTREVGRDNNINTEVILELSPEMIMTYSMTGDYSKLELYERSGIPVIQNAEYLEETPLGRAEWIKFTALFFGKEKEADSIFDAIANNYNRTLELVANVESTPTVFSGNVYGDTWYMPGGNSWASKYLKDAQADFLWKDTDDTGSLQLSFEAVYDKAHQADYWIGAANYYSKEALKGAEERYAEFGAFKNDKVYTYNRRQIENGGNDYFESGFSRPDLVLNDLVKILHPELLPEHELYYYRKLD